MSHDPLPSDELAVASTVEQERDKALSTLNAALERVGLSGAGAEGSVNQTRRTNRVNSARELMPSLANALRMWVFTV